VHKSVSRAWGRTRAIVLGAALLSGAALPAAGLWAGVASAAPTCDTTTCTTTTLSSSSNPSLFGQPLTFTAVVSPTNGGGTVAFKDGSTTISRCGSASLRLVGGSYKATCSTRLLSVGTHSITAVYSGTTGYTTSTSSPLSQVVDAAPTSITATARFNQQQTITLIGKLTSFGTGVPGELLTFSSQGTTLCTATTNDRGIAFCALTYNQSLTLRQNSGRYRVRFAGDSDYESSSVNGQAIIRH
jgi:hypothetical protein